MCDVQRMGIGDYIGIGLAKIGITKRRWARWTGIEEKLVGCNSCTAREQRLNHLGWRWQSRLNQIGWWIKHRYVWLKEAATKGIFRRCKPNRDS